MSIENDNEKFITFENMSEYDSRIKSYINNKTKNSVADVQATGGSIKITNGDGATKVITIAQAGEIAEKRVYRYGYRIKKDESDPSARVEYLYDAVGMTPAHMDFANGIFDYGSWGDKWFVTENKPCMMKSNGEIDYYLNPNDYAQREDNGMESDVTNTNYDGNAMSIMPLVWVYRYEDSDWLYEIFSNAQYDSNYKAYAHTRADGTIADWFAWSIYGGSGAAWDDKEPKIRSLSGQRLAYGLTAEQEIAGCKANGSQWYTHTWSQRELIRGLLILMGKSTDTQSVFGNGNCRSAAGESGLLVTGTLDMMGQFFGYNDSKYQVKVFHIEKFWGDQEDMTAGVLYSNDDCKVYVKMTPEGGGYRISDVTGYTDTGVTLPGSCYDGFISSMQCSQYGMIPTAVSDGSCTTYYCDYAHFNSGYGKFTYLLAGASAESYLPSEGGAFAFNVYYPPETRKYKFGCGLSCEQPAA